MLSPANTTPECWGAPKVMYAYMSVLARQGHTNTAQDAAIPQRRAGA